MKILCRRQDKTFLFFSDHLQRVGECRRQLCRGKSPEACRTAGGEMGVSMCRIELLLCLVLTRCQSLLDFLLCTHRAPGKAELPKRDIRSEKYSAKIFLFWAYFFLIYTK